jgi:hypothetical protein
LPTDLQTARRDDSNERRVAEPTLQLEALRILTMFALTASPVRLLFWGTLVLWAGAAAPTAAQDRTIATGDRVRLTLPCDSIQGATRAQEIRCTREGDLARLTSESVELLVQGTRETHAVATLTSLEVRRFEGPGWQIPVAAGALLGGAGTHVWLHAGGSTSLCDRASNQDAMSSGECAGLTVLGAAAGAGLGALTSRLLRTERWLPVPLGRIDLTLVRR